MVHDVERTAVGLHLAAVQPRSAPTLRTLTRGHVTPLDSLCVVQVCRVGKVPYRAQHHARESQHDDL